MSRRWHSDSVHDTRTTCLTKPPRWQLACEQKSCISTRNQKEVKGDIRLIEKFEKEKAENELKALRAPQFRIDESGYEISDFHSYESGFYGRETSPTNPIGDKLESPCSRKLTIYCNGEEVDEIYAYGNVNLDDREGTAKAYLKSYLSRKSYLAKKGGE